MKRLTVLAVLLLFSLSAVFALQGLVTWTWFENDPDVEYFRYQVDGEEDDKWTVVDWSVNEVTLLLDISVLHELHLQQSYDGENWSESSIVESEVFSEEDFMPPAEEDLTLEENLEGQEESEVVDFPEETVEQEPAQEEVVEEVVPEEPKYLPLKAFDYGIGYLNSIPDSAGPRTMGVSVAYSRTFAKVKEVFDIGFKANVSVNSSVELFTDISSIKLVSYANVLALVTSMVGNSDIYFAIGPDVGINLEDIGNSFKVGVSAEIGVRYHRTAKFALGFALADHHYFYPVDKMENRFDFRVFMSSVF